MSRSTIHGMVLQTFLIAASFFYLLSPTIFAYVSEVSMSYSHVPRWFAATAPARITARIFDQYNANPPRAARFRQHLTCFLADDGAKRNAGCTHEIRSGQGVHGPQDLEIASGAYTARFAFLGNAGCASGNARIQVATTGRFGRVLADSEIRIDAGRQVELPFRLPLMDAALAPVEFSATGVSGCVLLAAVDWTRTP
jgi:hypothetical protein